MLVVSRSFAVVKEFSPYVIIFMNVCIVTVAAVIIFCEGILGFMGLLQSLPW